MGTRCQKSSVALEDSYPKQWADKVAIPDWARIRVLNDSTFDYNTAILIAKKPNPWGPLQITVPIVSVVGALLLVAVIFVIYRTKSRERKSLPIKFTHWLCPRRSRRVRQAPPTTTWAIDQLEEYAVVHDDDEPRGSHIPFPSLKDIKTKTVDVEYQLPLKSVWKHWHFAQQLRRLPDQIPLPWKDQAVEITSYPPRRGFRLDSLNTSTESSAPNSRSATAEGGGGRPDTIFEDEPADDDEGTSLISHIDRSSNRVFVISGDNGPNFTVESASSRDNSRTSHLVVIPPTPTESSRSSQNRSSVAHRLSRLNPIRRLVLPPAPKQLAPLPPAPAATGTLEVQIPPEPLPHQPGPSHLPAPQPHVPQGRIASIKTLALSPRPVRLDLPPVSHVRRQQSIEDDGSLKRSHPQTRPMGARLPSSPRHHAQQLSLDDELSQNFSPSVHSVGDSMYMGSSTHAYRPLTPSSHNRTYSGDDVSATHGQFLTTPRLTHGRNLSTESLVPARSDPAMLFPGAVRGAGYTIGLSADASESSASLYSTTSASSGNARSLPIPPTQ
ncbi:hypothetical protein FPV67DRAFT_1667848 [Lyophyllum atratum]|nr:hypothetical protein FPV67DRAFT_1667848 [Lyophyllum atratum]